MADTSRVKLQPLGESRENIDEMQNFQAKQATCSHPADEKQIRSVISSDIHRFVAATLATCVLRSGVADLKEVYSNLPSLLLLSKHRICKTNLPSYTCQHHNHQS